MILLYDKIQITKLKYYHILFDNMFDLHPCSLIRAPPSARALKG